MLTEFVDVMKYWDYSLNTINPSKMTHKSGKKAYWTCTKCKHKWHQTIRYFVSNKNKCQKCNSVGMKYKDLCNEWNFLKNNNLVPYDVSCGSARLVWWKCNVCNNSWQAPVRDRIKGEKKCTFCNNIAQTHPAVAKLWHTYKNKDLTPKDVTIGSRKVVWWRCEKDHEWRGRISGRFSNGKLIQCPYCSGKKVANNTSLWSTHKYLCAEWDVGLNGDLTPKMVSKGTHKAVWWKCVNNHSWKASVNSRTNKQSGCPFCSKITLKDGTVCDSIPDAVKYLEYKENKLEFIYNKIYDCMLGKFRYDFYFPHENKYVEVTSFTKKSFKEFNLYWKYLKNIVYKKRFVENILA